MPSITAITAIAAPCRPTYSRPAFDFSPFAVVRDITLPRTTITEQVHAVQSAYHKLTGDSIDFVRATAVLDRILADRREYVDVYSPAPIPVELAEVASWLSENGYDRDGVYLAMRAIEKNGTAKLSGCIDGEDVPYIEAMLERIYAAV